MKKFVLLSVLGIFILSGISACKAKHCTAMDPTMEGYKARKDKKKRGRQEGLFGKQKRR